MSFESPEQQHPLMPTPNDKKPIEILREIVRLHDAGITPQIIRGNHRECEDWHDAIIAAKQILSAGTLISEAKCPKCHNVWPERFGTECPRCDTKLQQTRITNHHSMGDRRNWEHGEHSGTITFPGEERGPVDIQWDGEYPDDWETIEAQVESAASRSFPEMTMRHT